MLVLVFNCGSSSVKYQLYDMESGSSLSHGVLERIGGDATHKSSFKNKSIECNVKAPDHHSAIEIIADELLDAERGLLSDISDLVGIGHRVVHGGEEHSESVLIGEEVIESIDGLSTLAPLHNPPSLEGIKACKKIFPGALQVAVFDTAFHHNMPEYACRYGLPKDLYEKYQIRRYGFHGTSHRYVAAKASEKLGKKRKEANIITVHLGNGCSVAAVKEGVCVDTSMGFTPLEGLLMGTRSGDLDPAVVTFLMQKLSLSPEEVEDLLNKKSGLLGVSGVSNDMREILKAIESGHEDAKLAYDIFVYRIKKYIGSYAAVMGRVDAIVFTAGIGENVPQIKDSIAREIKGLFKFEPQILTITTDEELLIASDTYDVLRKSL